MTARPHTCYFICCTPRSGSYLLAEALTNSGFGGRPGEHFNHRVEPWHSDFTVENYQAAVQPVLDSGTSNGVFGTKVMWPPFSDFLGKLEILAKREGSTVTDVIAQIFPNPHYIMLTRRDKVRQMISFGRAWWTNVWRSTETEKQTGSIEDIELDPDDIELRMREIRENETYFRRFFAENGIQPFPVVYEDLVERYEETALEVLDFLGVDHPAHVEFAPRVLKRQWDDASDELLRRYYAARGIQPLEPIQPRRA